MNTLWQQRTCAFGRGCTNLPWLAVLAIAALPAIGPTAAHARVAQVTPIDQFDAPTGGSTSDNFGKSIAVNSEFGAVGAPGLTVTVSGVTHTAQGGVHLYANFGGGIFGYVHTLTHVRGVAADNCGAAVTSASDWVASGAPGRDIFTTSNQLQAGVVWAWHKGATWESTAHELTHPNPKSIDLFGSAVAMDEQGTGASRRLTIVVGAPTDDVSSRVDCGSVCVFEWSAASSSWVRTAFISAPLLEGEDSQLTAYGLFGSSIGTYGDYIVIGAKRQTVSTSKQGTAFVFRRNTLANPAPTILQTNPEWGEWCLVQRLTADVPMVDEQFGAAVSVSSANVIIGAPGGSNSPGSATMFDLDLVTGRFVLNAQVWPVNGHNGDQFGASVALKADVALVGAPGYDAGLSPIVANRGLVYLFHQDIALCGTWEPGITYYPPSSANVAEAQFGSAIDISGDVVAIAAVGAPNQQLGQGNVFSYALNTASCPSDLDGDGGVGGSDLALFFSHWGGCGPDDQIADFNHDGCVNGADLAYLPAIWGPCVCGH